MSGITFAFAPGIRIDIERCLADCSLHHVIVDDSSAEKAK
jgi:hypothetical protein